MPAKGNHHLFLIWLIFAGVAAFAFFVSWHMQWLQLVFYWDSSRISWVISVLFLVICCHAASRAYFVSSELSAVAEIRELVARLNPGEILIKDGRLVPKTSGFPECVVTDYLNDLFGHLHHFRNVLKYGCTPSFASDLFDRTSEIDIYDVGICR